MLEDSIIKKSRNARSNEEQEQHFKMYKEQKQKVQTMVNNSIRIYEEKIATEIKNAKNKGKKTSIYKETQGRNDRQ